MERYIAYKPISELEILEPEYTPTAGPEDTGNGTLTVQDLIPIQVIQNVGLVKGKKAPIRVAR